MSAPAADTSLGPVPAPDPRSVSTLPITDPPAHPLASPRLRSPLLIGATIALSAAVGAVQGSLAQSVLCGLLVVVLVPCTVIDLERRIIPNLLTGPGAVAALLLGTVLDPGGEPHRLLWAAIAGGFLLVTALAYPAGMGMGDVKLLGLMGLCLGPGAVVGLFVALLGQIGTGVVLALRKGVRAAGKTTLPFGPYLAAGGLVAALAGASLLHAYLHIGH